MSTSPTALISDLVVGVDHVGIAVPDLDAAKAWYAEHLGFTTLHEEVNDEQGVREAMVGPQGTDGAVIQLLAPLAQRQFLRLQLIQQAVQVGGQLSNLVALGHRAHARPVVAAFCRAHGAVHALDRNSGSSMWKQDKLLNRAVSGAAVQGSVVAVADAEGIVHFLSREDGSFVARKKIDCSPVRTPVRTLGSAFLVQTSGGSVSAIEAR